MPSLGDVDPPIALGALDGRYRSSVAPLVDHLSEAALNRERVRVEVEWLIHLTSYAAVSYTHLDVYKRQGHDVLPGRSIEPQSGDKQHVHP